MARIFLSYRRDDSKHVAVHLRERLIASFGNDSVFLDMSELPHGSPFPEEIDEAIKTCAVFFALIGNNWLGSSWRLGRRFRIRQPGDWVRHEIAQALRLGKFILPILIDGARMPSKRVLPQEIKTFAELNAAKIRTETFADDFTELEGELWRRLHDQYGVSELVARKYHRIPAIDDFFGRFAGPNAIYSNQGWRLDRLEVGIGFTDPALNRWLCADRPTVPIVVSNQRWLAVERYPHGRELRSFIVHNAIRRSLHMFNDKKIRLSSEISIGTPVKLQETDYESSLMTDQIAQDVVVSNELGPDGHTPRITIWTGIDKFSRFDDASGAITVLDFSDTGMSNQLGGSTLAFTRDGSLIVVVGNQLNLQSPRMLAPSGSGSCDWDDIEDARDLLTVAIRGAGRELQEECSLQPSYPGERNVAFALWPLAFTRMLHRGGKPEMYFLGFVDAEMSELIHRKRERYVAAVVPAVKVRPIDWSSEPVAPSIERACADYLKQLRSIGRIEGRLVQVSAPLEHGLKLLIEACQDAACSRSITNFANASMTRWAWVP